jgi:hypothetical protein
LQRWLGDVIEVNEVSIHNDEATFEVLVVYRRRDNGQLNEARFTSPSSVPRIL